MFPINAALVSKFSAADYAPARSNINAAVALGPMATNTISTAADTPSAVSAADTATSTVADRRYTKFDRSASQVGDADMSFSDVLDAVNPLQHIPVVSSVYRAVTNQPINPVSRITGDILYGGVFGLGSALLGTVGSVGDSIMISQTGRSMSGEAMAAVFGTDSAATTTPDKDTSPILLASNVSSPATQSSVASGAPMVLVANKYTEPKADISAAATASDVVTDDSLPVTTSDDDTPIYTTPGAPVIMAGYAAKAPVEPTDAVMSAGTEQDQTIASSPETSGIIDTVTIEAPSSYVSAAAIAVTPEPLASVNTSTANAATVVADATPQATTASSETPAEQPLLATKSYPINLNKQPYGGVMDMSGVSTLAQTVAQDPHATQLGHTIYPTSTAIRPRLVAATPLTPPASVTSSPATSQTATTTANTADSTTTSTGTTSLDATQQALIRDLIALREFKQPPANVFAAPAPRGSLVDVKN